MLMVKISKTQRMATYLGGDRIEGLHECDGLHKTMQLPYHHTIIFPILTLFFKASDP
jgi:hypothetical protein